MTIQSEYQLENELIAQLQGLGYATVTIKDERQLLSNLKTQIERANGLAPLSETEWKQVISLGLTHKSKKIMHYSPENSITISGFLSCSRI